MYKLHVNADQTASFHTVEQKPVLKPIAVVEVLRGNARKVVIQI